MNRYLALLRGINVGGKNLIKMADLAACVQGLGFTNVRTYIQSGNVIFDTNETDRQRVVNLLESAISKAFDYEASVVIRSDQEMEDIVGRAPEGYGSEPDRYRYDVIFLKEPLTPAEAMQRIQVEEGVDQVHAGNGVLYFSRLIIKASQSSLHRMISKPINRGMTIRNWNTTNKLLKMIQAEDH